MRRASSLRRSEPTAFPSRLALAPPLEPALPESRARSDVADAERVERSGGRARTNSRLCRLPMVRAGQTRIPREAMLLGSMPTELSEAGRREVRELIRYWEWADAVVSSPLRRARETATLLAGRLPVALEPNLRPRELGRWEGRPPAELRAIQPDLYERWQDGDDDLDLGDGESPQRFRARVASALEGLLAGPHRSVLVVSHQCVIRSITAMLVAPLPPARPWPAEMVLLTRQDGAVWRFGRRTSDPEPLRSPLERSGLSGRPFERPPERHVAPLTIPGRTDA